MAKDPIIFACANPTPEIFPDEAKAAGAAVVSTGRSDFPNQINNVVAFPGIFRGTFDAHARDINEPMKLPEGPVWEDHRLENHRTKKQRVRRTFQSCRDPLSADPLFACQLFADQLFVRVLRPILSERPDLSSSFRTDSFLPSGGVSASRGSPAACTRNSLFWRRPSLFH